jgi:hypothetical protein
MAMTGRNPWAVLRVAEGAPYEEIQRAFRRRVKQTHPDSGGHAVEFAAVVEAFEAVRTPAAPVAGPTRRRSTPYDIWTRPFPSGHSWGEDVRPLHAARFSADGEVSGGPGADFTAVLHDEVEKVLAASA